MRPREMSSCICRASSEQIVLMSTTHASFGQSTTKNDVITIVNYVLVTFPCVLSRTRHPSCVTPYVSSCVSCPVCCMLCALPNVCYNLCLTHIVRSLIIPYILVCYVDLCDHIMCVIPTTAT